MADAMACEVDQVDTWLHGWAAWVRCGRDAAGFPRVNVLHSSWMPPAPGVRPTMRTAPATDETRHRAVHRAVCRLSMRLANTVVVHYVYRLSTIDKAEALGCAASTVHQRLAVAREQIGADLGRNRGGFTN